MEKVGIQNVFWSFPSATSVKLEAELVKLNGKMEDDASVKQCRVVVELARALSERDPELAASYGF